MGIPDHLSCLLRNLYAGQEVTEPGMQQETGSKLGKEYIKAVCCYSAYLTYMQRGAGLVTKSCLTLAIPWTVAHQAPLSVGFPRQECWSGLPFPSPEDLPDPGIEPRSPALQADSLPTEL